jgi:hypothetical protein
LRVTSHLEVAGEKIFPGFKTTEPPKRKSKYKFEEIQKKKKGPKIGVSQADTRTAKELIAPIADRVGQIPRTEGGVTH